MTDQSLAYTKFPGRRSYILNMRFQIQRIESVLRAFERTDDEWDVGSNWESIRFAANKIRQFALEMRKSSAQIRHDYGPRGLTPNFPPGEEN